MSSSHHHHHAATSPLLKQQNHRLDLLVGLCGGGCLADASCEDVSLNDALRIFASSSGGNSNASTHCRVRSRGSIRRSLRGSNSLIVLLNRAAGCDGWLGTAVVVVVAVTRVCVAFKSGGGWFGLPSGGAALSVVVAATATGTGCGELPCVPLSGNGGGEDVFGGSMAT